jgi:hypothetical protein
MSLKIITPKNSLIYEQALAVKEEKIANKKEEKSSFFWQVYFFPKDDVVNPSSFVAYCPFTKIFAEGKDVQEAAIQWTESAKVKFPEESFTIPKYLLQSRKVLYGEYLHGNRDIPVFILDFTSKLNLVVFPYTQQTLAGSFNNINPNSIPSLLMDWRVYTTPLMCCEPTTDGTWYDHSQTPHIFSQTVTPNSIN